MHSNSYALLCILAALCCSMLCILANKKQKLLHYAVHYATLVTLTKCSVLCRAAAILCSHGSIFFAVNLATWVCYACACAHWFHPIREPLFFICFFRIQQVPSNEKHMQTSPDVSQCDPCCRISQQSRDLVCPDVWDLDIVSAKASPQRHSEPCWICWKLETSWSH